MSIHQPGAFNIESLVGGVWRGGMNRAERHAAIDTAIKWSAEDGTRYRVFDLEGRVIFDTHAVAANVFSIDVDTLHGVIAVFASPNTQTVVISSGPLMMVVKDDLLGQLDREVRDGNPSVTLRLRNESGFLIGPLSPNELKTLRIAVAGAFAFLARKEHAHA